MPPTPTIPPKTVADCHRLVAYAGSFLSKSQCREIRIDPGYSTYITNRFPDPPSDADLISEGFTKVSRSAAGQARWQPPHPRRKALEAKQDQRVAELQRQVASLERKVADQTREADRLRSIIARKQGERHADA